MNKTKSGIILLPASVVGKRYDAVPHTSGTWLRPIWRLGPVDDDTWWSVLYTNNGEVEWKLNSQNSDLNKAILEVKTLDPPLAVNEYVTLPTGDMWIRHALDVNGRYTQLPDTIYYANGLIHYPGVQIYPKEREYIVKGDATPEEINATNKGISELIRKKAKGGILNYLNYIN